jgi:serine/threonine-protein kinase
MPLAPDLAGLALDERYELEDVLGEGSFGRVYRGRDRRLGRAVAVKVIKPWWAEDSDWVERFQREAKLLARVSDPGVVQIFDIGHADEGPYYVAELVEGESLADRLSRGPVRVAEARAIAEQLCSALASAHRAGIVHCDVKPANVLLTAGGGVKVGDFSIARLVEGSSHALSVTLAGTPRYMSPEQARGRPPSAATDVYSAGVVLYEMLAGTPPFPDGSPVELGLHHLQDAPPPLPEHVPPPLREVVERALAKDPGDRYADGAAMAEALHAAGDRGEGAERALPSAGDAQPVSAAQPSRSGRAADGANGAKAVEGASRASARPASRGTFSQAQTVDLAAATRLAPARTRMLPRAGSQTAPPPRGPRSRVHARRRLIAAFAGAFALVCAALLALVLFGGAARTTVPQLRGLPRGGVEARARRAHLQPAFSTRYADANAGIAIAQAPVLGARVADGSTVHVVLSAGPPPVSVPAAVGQPAASAEGAIEAAGLRYAVSEVAAPASRAGTVVRESPGPPASAPRGSTIALSVAETPVWRALTTFSGVDDGRSVAFHILGSRWRVTYSMSFQGTCLLLVVCGGPSAEARNLQSGAGAGGFELEEGESQAHVFNSGPGTYRLLVSGGRDSARWSMTVEDDY